VSLRAFQAFSDFRGEASAFTWLYRIAVNVVNRHRERRSGEPVPFDTPEVIQLTADEAAGPEAMALQSDLRAAVWSALHRLSPELRTTLILQVYEGLRYHEIASILHVPIGTVKSRLHHAMQRLREECKQYAV
jgi:RNA polymerase sigma-70 factor (ECF subfamily)